MIEEKNGSLPTVAENERRNKRFKGVYDPLKGVGAYGERREFDASHWRLWVVYLPLRMFDNPLFNAGMSATMFREMRHRYDFEYWCADCVKIHNKETRRVEPFILNHPQRRLLAVMEKMREEGKPVRVILLKARQWGGSTLTQLYMAWWQIVLHENCHSVICSHLKDTSSAIRAMYNRVLANYPEGLGLQAEIPETKQKAIP